MSDADATIADARRAMREQWGYESFRPGQQEVIEAVLDGRDVLGVLPTGGGKSICYQVPALLADGCVLVEEWSSVGGGSGISVNYYDPAAGEWVQVWNGSGGTQITIRGGLDEEGSMDLRGTLHYVGRDRTVPFRGLWTPLPDGRVRQYFEQSTDEGETWQPWFEGFYNRAGETGEGSG